MTSAEDIQGWWEGMNFYDEGNLQKAIETLSCIKQNAKITFNTACCYLVLGNVPSAQKKYKETVQLDSHMLIAHYMLGLTFYHESKFELAIKKFQTTHDLLRGNRYLDYRQHGLNYQIYSCEVLTNLAAAFYEQNRIGKAKGYLLQAVGCKAEKKHESIVDTLSDLQAGFAIHPFVPPQSAVFRPSKSSVDNMKKKNYLGKAKVLSTENEENVYACFSGLRNNHIPQAQLRPRPVARQDLLKDLRLPNRKISLKTISTRPTQPETKLGRVVTNFTRKPLPLLPVETRDKSKCSAGTDSKTMPVRPKNPSTRNIASIINLRKQQEECVEYEIIEDKQFDTQFDHNHNQTSTPVVKARTRKGSLSNITDRSLPPTPPNNKRRENIANIVAPPRTCYPRDPTHSEKSRNNIDEQSKSENVFFKSMSADEVINPVRKYSPRARIRSAELEHKIGERSKLENELSRTLFTDDAEVKNVPCKDIDVQVTFVQRVKIPQGSCLMDLKNMMKAVKLPDSIELCFNNDIGRQQPLTEENYRHVLFESDQKKLYCFPT